LRRRRIWVWTENRNITGEEDDLKKANDRRSADRGYGGASTWNQFTTNNIPAANVGETLFLGFVNPAANNSNRFGMIDDVTLEVTAAKRGTVFYIR
jgi:hypothetical protein